MRAAKRKCAVRGHMRGCKCVQPNESVPSEGLCRGAYFVEAVSYKAFTMFITEGIISGVLINISVM